MDPITTTYMECPQCGRKAMSIATRCPHCGVAFPSKPLQRSVPGHRLDRLGPVLAVGGVMILGAVLLALVVPRLGSKAAAPAAVAADSASEGVASDSVVPIQPPVVSAAPVTPTPAGPLARRFARTWVNVRGGRGRGASVVRVLNPGDAVQVDSLNRGWYRVLIDGHAVGYVHRSNLDPVSPPR